MYKAFKLSNVMIVMTIGLTAGAYGADAPAPSPLNAGQIFYDLSMTNVNQFDETLQSFIGKTLSQVPGHEDFGLINVRESQHAPTQAGFPRWFRATYRTNRITPGIFVNTRNELRLTHHEFSGSYAGIYHGDIVSFNPGRIGAAVAVLAAGTLYVFRDRIRPYLNSTYNRLTSLFKKSPEKAQDSTPLKA